jgi:hypothetical protein
MVKLLFKRSSTAGIKQIGRELQAYPQLPVFYLASSNVANSN